MPVPQITVLPDPPSRQDPTNFAVKGDAFLGALPDFATEANALATQVNERVDAAFDAGLEGAATNAATTVTKAAEARASELAAAGFANEAMLLSLGVETLRPSIKPSLLLDFARAQVVPPSVTFTRASTATRVGPSGLIETVGINVPRLDYDPITRACLGLLVEEQRRNLLLRSEEFDNASWIKADTTVSPNVTVAPNGLSVADKLISTASSAIHNLTFNVTPGPTFSFSVFVKKSEYNFCTLILSGSAIRSTRTFNLTTGEITNPFNSASTFISAKAEPFQNGWFRLTLSSTSANFTQARIALAQDAVSSHSESGQTFTGDGASGIFIWGAQIEAGSFYTSYIPTTTASVTRAPDLATLPSIAPWFRTDEGTLFVEASTFRTFGSAFSFQIDSGADTNRLVLNTSGNRGDSLIDGVNVAPLIGAIQPANTNIKSAYAYRLNDYGYSFNGTPAITDTSADVPQNLTTARVGSRVGGGEPLSGLIRQIKYFPQRLTNAQLQALTSL